MSANTRDGAGRTRSIRAPASPVRHALASVTVLHPECMEADALATVLTVLGPDDGLAFACAHGVAALFVCGAATLGRATFASARLAGRLGHPGVDGAA